MENTVKTLSVGFGGQRIVRFPKPSHDRYRDQDMTQSLWPMSVGHYPRAPRHLVERPHGIDNHLIMLCSHGRGFLERDGQRYTLKPGDMALVERNTPHAYGSSDDQPWGKYWVHFDGKSSNRLFTHLKNECKPVVFPFSDPSGFIERFEQLYHWCTQAEMDVTHAHITNALLNLILFTHGELNKVMSGQRQDHKILECIENMIQDCAQDFIPAEMAQTCGLSEASFFRHFKRKTNATPIQFLTRIRIQQACQWLDLSGLTIAEIAYKVGYEDPLYFSRIFSKAMGQSPKQYRLERVDTVE
jgi:AraC-like DNA-binding protein